jgi:acetyltransferase-like isoleucine patch superfamily enzyme
MSQPGGKSANSIMLSGDRSAGDPYSFSRVQDTVQQAPRNAPPLTYLDKETSLALYFTFFGRFLHKLAFVAPGGGSVRPWLHRLRGAQIGNNVWIAQLVYIDELHPGDVEIGDNCTIGYRTSIFAHFYWGRRRPTGTGKVIIDKDVFIGPHCVILPNVRIGEGAVIRAGTVVSRNVPAHALWGSPNAELLGIATVPLTPEHSYEEFARGIQPRSRFRPAAKSAKSGPL